MLDVKDERLHCEFRCYLPALNHFDRSVWGESVFNNCLGPSGEGITLQCEATIHIFVPCSTITDPETKPPSSVETSS